MLLSSFSMSSLVLAGTVSLKVHLGSISLYFLFNSCLTVYAVLYPFAKSLKLKISCFLRISSIRYFSFFSVRSLSSWATSSTTVSAFALNGRIVIKKLFKSFEDNPANQSTEHRLSIQQGFIFLAVRNSSRLLLVELFPLHLEIFSEVLLMRSIVELSEKRKTTLASRHPFRITSFPALPVRAKRIASSKDDFPLPHFPMIAFNFFAFNCRSSIPLKFLIEIVVIVLLSIILILLSSLKLYLHK